MLNLQVITQTIESLAGLAPIEDWIFGGNTQVEAAPSIPLEQDAYDFANGVIIDGVNDAWASNDLMVSGHFRTIAGNTVYVSIEINEAQDGGDEIVYTVGGNNYNQRITTNLDMAIWNMYDCLLGGFPLK